MTRRTLLASALALFALPVAVLAQPASPGPRVGILAQDLQPGLLETFRDELQKRGFMAGKNITIDVRNADGRSERLPAFAQELLRLKADVILAVNTPAALAAQKATTTVPIVFVRVADPVKAGLVRSLAHPGGNLTGVNFLPDELGAKGLETLREVLPNVGRIASLYKADNPGALLVVTETERRSAPLDLRFLRLPVRDAGDFPALQLRAARADRGALRHGRRRDDEAQDRDPQVRGQPRDARRVDLPGFCARGRPTSPTGPTFPTSIAARHSTPRSS